MIIMSSSGDGRHKKSRSSSVDGNLLQPEGRIKVRVSSSTASSIMTNVTGKEAILRTSYGQVRQSFRRKVREPKAKYHRLDGGGSGGNGHWDASSQKSTSDRGEGLLTLSSTGKVPRSHKSNSGMSVGEIFSTMRRGMASFTLPFTVNKNNKKSSLSSKPGRKRDAIHILSASSTDLRMATPPPPPMTTTTTVDSPTSIGSGTTDHQNNNNNKSPSTPGITGIRNHGNTCYMNAVVQCLSHTDLFAEYFVMDQYKVDMTRRRNKTNAKRYGTKGELTEQLAILFKSLWSSRYSPEISNQFRNVVGKYASQYQGNNQQDAQEFLLWLLDKVHEDLNTATKKKYKKVGSNLGRPDEVVAAEALENHMRCNSSFVHGLFQAQYRSSLTCPKCRRQSITFDPFLCISTPIPQRQTRPVVVTVVYLNQQPKQVKLGLSVNVQATIQEIRSMLAADTGIPSKQMILTELHQDNFGRTFRDCESINVIHDTDNVYAIEVPPARPADDREGAEYLLMLWINKLGVGTQAKRFGCPYVTQVNRLATYIELQKAVLKAESSILKGDILEQEDAMIRFRVVDGIPGSCYLPDDVDHPLYMATVDVALGAASKEGRGPLHLKLGVEWSREDRNQYVGVVDDVVEEHSTVIQMKNQQNQRVTATLDDCFNLYTQDEKLGPEDPWLCPSCKRPQQGVKKLGLWSVPDILIIHLKRFRQTKTQRTKLDTAVGFPVQSLDMSPHIVDRSHELPATNGLSVLHWSPWKRSRHHSNRLENNVYDLYAVCNHHGSMQSGHYTAYCKNPTNGLWYCFDDTNVKPIDETEIVSPSAYILFYQRRTLVSASSSDSSSCGYYDHWAYRMPSFQYSLPKVSKSHDNLCDLDGRIPNGDVSVEKSFLRGTRKYSSMMSLGIHKRKADNNNKLSVAASSVVETNQDDDDGGISSGLIIPESSV